MKIKVGDQLETIFGTGIVASIPPNGVTQAAMIRVGAVLVPVLCEGDEVIDSEKRLRWTGDHSSGQ